MKAHSETFETHMPVRGELREVRVTYHITDSRGPDLFCPPGEADPGGGGDIEILACIDGLTNCDLLPDLDGADRLELEYLCEEHERGKQ